MQDLLSHPVVQTIRSNMARMGVSFEDAVVIGVSGGVDSMVLLQILHQLGFAVTAAHVNFKLRGVEADNDALFVEKWCLSANIPFLLLTEDTKAYAEKYNLNTQLAAREIRYAWWDELVRHNNYNWVATAHHLDDAAETLMMNVLRGTGIKGLRGIPEKRSHFIRPMLNIRRHEIEAFAARYSIPFQTDASNLTEAYQRNRIRQKLMPLAEEIQPGLHARLQQTMHRADVEWIAFDDAYQQWIKQSVLRAGDGFLLRGHEAHLAFKLRWLEEKGFPWQLAFDYLTAPQQDSGKILEHHQYILSRTSDGHFLQEYIPMEKMLLHKPGTFSFGAFTIEITELEKTDYRVPVDAFEAFLDARAIQWPLEIRHIEPGDAFQPLGMHGHSKKLQDFLVDLKLEPFEKKQQLVLTHKSHILWVIGHRIDERAKVKEDTSTIVRLRYARTD